MSNKIELVNDDKLEQISGGVWTVLVGLAIAVMFEIVNNPNDAKQGYADGLSAGMQH